MIRPPWTNPKLNEYSKIDNNHDFYITEFITF